METVRDIMTPEQAADYLQVDRETVYRYIRDGKLVASKLGRSYRIPKASVNLLLWATRTRKDITLREYTGDEVARFIQADRLDVEAQQIAERFRKAGLDSREWMDVLKHTNEAADLALEHHGEPSMSLEELQRAVDECIGGAMLSEEIVRQRQAGW